MTGGMLGMTEWTSARLRINRRPYILYPTVLCHFRRGPFVLPAGVVLSVPPGVPLSVPSESLCPSRPGSFCLSRRLPLCHSRRFLAGIQGLFLLSLPSGGSVWEKILDSRLKMSGMTGGASGRTEVPREERRDPGKDGGVSGITEGPREGQRGPLPDSVLTDDCTSFIQ